MRKVNPHITFVLMIISLVALLALAGPAAAHDTEVVKSDPAAEAVLAQSPATVTAVMSEELQTKVSTIQVFNAAGQQVDKGDGGVDLNDADHATLKVSLPPLPAGGYVVRWHAVLLDQDASDGSFIFYVGQKVVLAEQAGSSGAASPAQLAETAAPAKTGFQPALFLVAGVGGAVLTLALIAFLGRMSRPRPR